MQESHKYEEKCKPASVGIRRESKNGKWKENGALSNQHTWKPENRSCSLPDNIHRDWRGWWVSHNWYPLEYMVLVGRGLVEDLLNPGLDLLISLAEVPLLCYFRQNVGFEGFQVGPLCGEMCLAAHDHIDEIRIYVIVYRLFQMGAVCVVMYLVGRW